MEKKQLNNELTLTYPSGFHVMGKEELEKHQYFGEPPAWSISDPERHMMISIAWKKTNGFVAKLLNTRDIVQKMEAGIRTPMQQFGYQLEGFLSLEAGGKNADGYRYSYTVQETGMTGESLCIKNKNTFFGNNEKIDFRCFSFTIWNVNIAKNLVFGNMNIVN